jgi:hypothetical protein
MDPSDFKIKIISRKLVQRERSYTIQTDGQTHMTNLIVFFAILGTRQKLNLLYILFFIMTKSALGPTQNNAKQFSKSGLFCQG